MGRLLQPPGYQASPPACIDGWMGGGGCDGRMGGQPKSKKIMYFQHFSKTIQYFFLVVSLPFRRHLNTFSEKNSKKKIFYVKIGTTMVFGHHT